ncbi:MAG: two-component sensor histidine kinase [Firmicutes bacterium]|nr:two-component sensor histidine kinase [Bacillota bacterium]
MLRLQRMKLLGEVAAEVVHEIRNPIAVLRGMLQVLKERSGAGDRECFDLMLDEVDRVNAMVGELLCLAGKGGQPIPSAGQEPSDLNLLLRRIYPLLAAYASAEGKRVLLITEELPRLALNENEMRQLILNLARNGLEAMGSDGTLTISTGCQPGEVVLAFADQGGGIEPEMLARLGTPFLSAKGGGTGLGLAVCYRIAERHQARIVVKTSPGGTTFQVRFHVD